jgi:hypothetical protein
MKKVKHIYLNYSTFDAFKSCEEKVNFELVKMIQPKSSGIVGPGLSATQKGTLIHACIDTASKNGQWHQTFEEILNLNPAYSAIHELKPSQSGSAHHLESLICAYMDRYELPNDKDFKVIASELKLQRPINDWLTSVGTLDRIGMRSEETIGVDTKTTTQLGRYLEPSVEMSDQFSQYILLARANGYNINSFLVDGICTDKTAFDKNENLFMRYETFRSEERLKDFEKNFLKVAERLRTALESNDFIPAKNKVCYADFGKKCAFYDICSSQTAEQQGSVISNMFETKSPSETFKVIWEE